MNGRRARAVRRLVESNGGSRRLARRIRRLYTRGRPVPIVASRANRRG